jgi:hypothetical protein
MVVPYLKGICYVSALFQGLCKCILFGGFCSTICSDSTHYNSRDVTYVYQSYDVKPW